MLVCECVLGEGQAMCLLASARLRRALEQYYLLTVSLSLVLGLDVRVRF
jgi:hypothetical protein